MNLAPRYLDHLDPHVLERFPVLARHARRVGGTPLWALPKEPGAARILAKCEWANPGGTVKARVAFAMLYRLLGSLSTDELRHLRVLEYTGGSLGVALSQLCRELCIPLTLVLSSSTPAPTLAALHADGTEMALVDRERGFWGVMETAFELSRQWPDVRFLHQHANEANLWIHRCTTGREIVAQMGQMEVTGADCVWLASIGTGGTLIGVHQALREAHPGMPVYAVTPAELPYGSALPPNAAPKFAGSGGLGCGRKQPFVEPEESCIERHLTCSYPEALRGMRDFAARTRIRIGSSAAANWLAARAIGRELGKAATVVTVFPSLATREEWRKAQESR